MSNPETVTDPLTGELVYLADPDQVAEALRRANATISSLYAFKNRLCRAAADLARFDGDCRTGRARGEKYRLKVEKPADSWDQGQLRRLWDFSPDMAPQFLGIATLRVKYAEYQKLLREAGGPAFERFRQDLLACNRGPTGVPRVSVEDL